ncbi:hypothetical protein [Rhizobium leguminosarum]|uniref:hypothetical protein n=1 Tax=Rhizobium TaxID=379 RepID=UPI001C945960|nr:hypothetical protein [Rhizobium leguminosarum]MBY5392960.1 hypothetical protein [Rhizobium leguminosarum]MBY5434421.1 hypothetical protein [Rhizobium leguminosarum]
MPPGRYSATESFDVEKSREAASEQYKGPFEFAGVIDKVVIDLKWEEGRFAMAGEATWTTGNAVAFARNVPPINARLTLASIRPSSITFPRR